MFQYVIAGLVLGGIYAIAAAGLVVTFQSAGILNFAFGAIAYAVARFFYFLNTQHSWAIAPAALLSILGLGPALGLGLYVVVFRRLQLASTLVKVVTTVGIAVSIPPAATLIFGNQTILSAPGLAPEPVRVFKFLGVPVTMDQVIVYCCVVVIVTVGAVVLRYTDVGLRVRAMVDSPAMTSISGTDPQAVSMGVWAASTTLAGLAGVLAAPIIGLDAGDFTLLMVAAFAAVIAGRLRNLPVAVAVGLGMGVVGSLVQYLFPPSSAQAADVLPSIPFIVTAIFLVYFMLRGTAVDEDDGVGGSLDRSIAVHSASRARTPRAEASFGWRSSVAGFLLVCIVPLFLRPFWVGLIGEGAALAIILLSITLVTGESGMIWLCQATFAGFGAVLAAQLSVHHGWPVLAGVVVGGLAAIPLGVIIGFLTIRMGNLYVALVTLTFGLLFEYLVFGLQVFSNDGIGVNVTPPAFAGSARGLTYLALAVFGLLALVVLNLRRSTTGLALAAIRTSPDASRTMGISVVRMKVLAAGLSAFVAGIGGSLYALSVAVALPTNYSTLGGLVWLAILVTLGIRSNMAALMAGLSQCLLAGIALVYLPTEFGQVTPVLFGLGAVQVAKFPDGVMTENARQVLWAMGKLEPFLHKTSRRFFGLPARPDGVAAAPVVEEELVPSLSEGGSGRTP